MKNLDKDYEMNRFENGKTNIMIATTVIDVGVNITNAGSGYTSVPVVTIVGAAAGTATITKGAAFSADERITASDLSSAVYTALTSPTG